MIYSSLFLLFCLVIGNDKLIKPSIRTLEEGVELRNIEMGSDQVHLFRLETQSNTCYEIKLSYSAAIPTNFIMELRISDMTHTLNTKNILDTNQLSFCTDTANAIILPGSGIHTYETLLYVTYNELSPSVNPTYNQQERSYNLLLTPKMNGIPDIVPVFIVKSIWILFAACLFFPFIYRYYFYGTF